MGSIEADTMNSEIDACSSSSSSSPVQDSNHSSQQHIQHIQHQHQHLHHRGRSHRKRSQSTEENVCVVAFLLKAQSEKQKKTLDQIQDIRRRFDQAYRRWEPHLTLIPPFIVPFSTPLVEDQSIALAATAQTSLSKEPIEEHTLLRDTLNQLCRTIETVCHSIDQHTFTLDEVGHFALKRYDTIHLRPSTSANNDCFLHLQSELERALPLALSNARSKKGQSRDAYKPHLTLGQSSSSNIKGNQELHDLANKVLMGQSDHEDEEEPFRIRVDKIQLMVKPANMSGPYDVYREFSLKDVD